MRDVSRCSPKQLLVWTITVLLLTYCLAGATDGPMLSLSVARCVPDSVHHHPGAGGEAHVPDGDVAGTVQPAGTHVGLEHGAHHER